MREPGRLGGSLGVAGLAIFAACLVLGVGRGVRAADEDMPHGDLALDCGDCHREEQWVPVVKPPVFKHEQTSFALVGAHLGVSCRSCHKTLVFNRVGTACADCHKDAHRGENGLRCEICHSPQSWTNRLTMTQAHARARFPLGGAHASLDCRACHRNQPPEEYVHTPTECVACHAQDHARTTQPNHAQAGFGRNCEECHSVVGRAWGSGFVHPAAFPLVGGHKGLTCSTCHKNGFSRLSTQCYDCHAADYQRTTNPNHVASRFPTTCAQCHGSESWRPARIDHSLTRFPLTGKHQQVACERCHPGGRYTGTPTQCNACHDNDFRGTTNPNHLAGSFPRTCESCHATAGWRPATFDHSITDFPLTGAHQNVACARCHAGGVYTGTSTACYSCHAANYNGSTNPNHVAGQFPRTCQDCHTTAAWRPASFNHNSTGFPLTGAHTSATCAQCHPGGRYSGTPTDCNSCHAADYNGTTNPNHAAAQFPRTCQDCHSTTGWRPATFDHDGRFFPIYSGTHRGRWSTCADCHVNSSNYRVFECIFCHPHSDRTETDNHHRGESGYAYSSPRCYACHPRGQADLRLRRFQ